MHGLVNFAIEGFLRDTYGVSHWQAIAQGAALPMDRFEPLLSYPPDMTEAVLAAASQRLGRTSDTLLEDMGTWLVSDRSGGRLRRLLRFGGVNFLDFLHSLEELPDRARLALPDFSLPEFDLSEQGSGYFRLCFSEPFPGAGNIIVGLLRAMADDYGALVLIEGAADGVSLHLLDAAHAEARHFHLADMA